MNAMKTLNTFRAELLALPVGDDLELLDVQAVLRAAGLRLAVVPAT